jgi:phage-related protein
VLDNKQASPLLCGEAFLRGKFGKICLIVQNLMKKVQNIMKKVQNLMEKVQNLMEKVHNFMKKVQIASGRAFFYHL